MSTKPEILWLVGGPVFECLPFPGSVIKYCSIEGCGAALWISPASFHRLDTAQVICPSCLPEKPEQVIVDDEVQQLASKYMDREVSKDELLARAHEIVKDSHDRKRRRS